MVIIVVVVLVSGASGAHRSLTPVVQHLLLRNPEFAQTALSSHVVCSPRGTHLGGHEFSCAVTESDGTVETSDWLYTRGSVGLFSNGGGSGATPSNADEAATIIQNFANQKLGPGQEDVTCARHGEIGNTGFYESNQYDCTILARSGTSVVIKYRWNGNGTLASDLPVTGAAAASAAPAEGGAATNTQQQTTSTSSSATVSQPASSVIPAGAYRSNAAAQPSSPGPTEPYPPSVHGTSCSFAVSFTNQIVAANNGNAEWGLPRVSAMSCSDGAIVIAEYLSADPSRRSETFPNGFHCLTYFYRPRGDDEEPDAYPTCVNGDQRVTVMSLED